MARIALLLLTLGLSGCLLPITRAHTAPLPINLAALPHDTTITDTLWVTRLDGRVLQFPGPTLLGNDGISGRTSGGGRPRVYFTPRDSIAKVVIVRRELRLLPTIAATTVASVAAAAAIMAAFLSIWT